MIGSRIRYYTLFTGIAKGYTWKLVFYSEVQRWKSEMKTSSIYYDQRSNFFSTIERNRRRVLVENTWQAMLNIDPGFVRSSTPNQRDRHDAYRPKYPDIGCVKKKFSDSRIPDMGGRQRAEKLWGRFDSEIRSSLFMYVSTCICAYEASRFSAAAASESCDAAVSSGECLFQRCTRDTLLK